jgi:hypothetical protein
VAQAPVLPAGFELPLAQRLPRIGSIDAVSLEERAAWRAPRAVQKGAQIFARAGAVRPAGVV